jgi:hypothetical protein
MRIYVLKSRWDWDEGHNEYATINLEECDLGGRVLKDLEDPTCSDEYREMVFKRFIDIARIQNGSPVSLVRPVVIYRVVSTEEQPKENGEEKIIFQLKPVFRFDPSGEPHPIP